VRDVNTRTALILVDHGSRFHEANDMLLEVVAMVKELSGLERVYPAHMELAEPSIRQAFGRAVNEGATAVVVHPYFLSPGRHSTNDIPRMVEEAAQAFSGVEHCVTAPLGLHTKIGEVVLERAGVPCRAAKVPA
jgi:sirohydrochlorin ferrochelatase